MKKAANYIRDNKVSIIEIWEKRVKSEIDASKGTPSLALRNQLPHVLEDIAEVLEKHEVFEQIEDSEHYREIVENSTDHGRHRATTSNYTVTEILKEYMVFHQVLTEELRKQEAYSVETGIVLKFTIETAMLHSAGSFNDSINQMKEKMVGTLVHDIRNPISAAYLALDLLDIHANPEHISKVKKMAVNSLDYSMRLIEGLLDAITLEAGEGITLNFEETDILQDIKWVVKETRTIFQNEINLNSDSPEIRGIFDAVAIRRALENLVTNAVKYGDNCQPVNINIFDNQDEVFICVHNTGKAIPVEKQKKIFNYLHSEKSAEDRGFKSWGMGLCLVKAVTKAHGGYIEVTSDDEQGTEFRIRLKKYKNQPGKIKSRITYNQN
ncbi:sensor histidine kinase [Gramella sp. BOM4]|nr:sensor histidine kinase [Christiangramia bathymodioli]